MLLPYKSFWGNNWKDLVVFSKATAMKQSYASAVAASLRRTIKLSKKQCEKTEKKNRREIQRYQSPARTLGELG